MALIEVSRDGVRAEIVSLGDTPDSPNPCTPARLEFDRGGLIAASIAGTEQDVGGGHVRWRPRAAPTLRV
jgi:hypothetical protein